MSISQFEKAEAFAALHARDKLFVIGNTFDGLSARMLAAEGFEALATSSWVQAAMLGQQDGHTSRDLALSHAKIIVAATDLPVSADLENGFGDTSEDVAETIRQAAKAGLVGCTIEDATGVADTPIYEFDQAVARIKAGVKVARQLPFKFMLTARSENFVRGIQDLDDTINRLQAFEAAGADVLMAPGLPDLDAVRRVCASISKPVNFMAGIPGRSFTVDELADAGVSRISLAQSIYTHAMKAAANVAREILQSGTFGYLDQPTHLNFTALLRT